MFKASGFRSKKEWLFVFADSLLILAGIFLGNYLRLGRNVASVFDEDHLAIRVIVVVLVMQLCLHYFDLYDDKIFGERKKAAFLLVGALGASSAILAVVYYMIPSFMVGRGIFAISLLLISLFIYSWRVFYSYVLKAWAPKEKVLIIGTGELAKKVKDEILDNQGFEIVGFIDEKRDKIGRSV